MSDFWGGLGFAAIILAICFGMSRCVDEISVVVATKRLMDCAAATPPMEEP